MVREACEVSIKEITTVVHCKRSPYDVYIGRGSLWGNSFKIGVDGARSQVIASYRDWLTGDDYLWREQDRRFEILANLHTLKGKVLGCWCKPLACHGDVLIMLIKKLGI